jgi:hypothetical protein
LIEEDDNQGEKTEEEKNEEGLKPKRKNKKAEARVIPIDRFPGDEAPPLEVPYYTIEMIFNTRNVYANRQHHDPTKIYYNIYNPLFISLIGLGRSGILLLIKRHHQRRTQMTTMEV